MRRWIIEKLLTPSIKDEIYKDIWEQGKSKGRLTYKQEGNKVVYKWSNADKIVANMSYEEISEVSATPTSTGDRDME